MKTIVRADLKETGKFYDDNVFKEKGFENPEFFKKDIIKIILKHDKNLMGKKLLDVGCGNGNVLELAENYFETYGIDISKNAIKIARTRCKKTVFYVSPAEKLRFRNDFFDCIVCIGSLEHFVDIDPALSEMKRVLKKDCIAIIHVPNSRYLIHKILRIKYHGQINERMATEREWKEILEKYFKVIKCYKYNTRWYFKWIPKKYCCHFTFLCQKTSE